MNGKITAEQLNIWIEWTETRMIVHKNLNRDLNVIQVFIDSILFTQAISNDLICISRYCVNKNRTPFKWIELKDFGNKCQAALWCVCHGCVCVFVCGSIEFRYAYKCYVGFGNWFWLYRNALYSFKWQFVAVENCKEIAGAIAHEHSSIRRTFSNK